MKRLYFFFLFCIGVGVCATPPKWFIQNQNHDMLIGLGSGSDINQAKNNALNDLASLIRVDVDSTFSLKQERQNIALNERATSELQLKVADVELVGVEVLNAEAIDGIYYVKMGIRKDLFLSQIHQKLERILEKVSLDHFKKCSFLDLKSFLELKELFKKLEPKIKTFNALSQQAFFNPKLEKLKNIYSKNMPKPQANFMAQNLDLILQNSLAKEFSKFVFINQKPLDSASHILLQGQSFGDKSVLNVSITDCSGVVIFQDQLEFDSRNSLKRANFIIFKRIRDWIGNLPVD